MDFNLLTDKEIIKELAFRCDAIRVDKKLTEKDVSKVGGTTIDAIYRFKTGKNISITNFIKILRGIGEIDMLDQLLREDSPKSIRKDKISKRKKRVHKPTLSNEKGDFVWGDDE
jgi:predicted transcriptional regulator